MKENFHLINLAHSLYQSVVSAVKALEGESLPENIGTNIVVVTKDNLNDADIRAILGF